MPQKPAISQLAKSLIAGLLFVLLGLLTIRAFALVYRHPFHPLNLQRVEQTGNVIVAALEAHRDKYGTYPESLDELVSSGTLSSLPTVKWGTREWEYFPPDQGEQYNLRIRANRSGYECCFYIFGAERWGADY